MGEKVKARGSGGMPPRKFWILGLFEVNSDAT